MKLVDRTSWRSVEQGSEGLDSAAKVQPEKRLMLAVLEDAVHTFQKDSSASTAREYQVFAEAEEWFASDEIGWPFSFVNVCNALGLDVDYIRAGLRRWRDRRSTLRGGHLDIVELPSPGVTNSERSATWRSADLPRSA
jgi:hypothetical protein